jgi:ABC-type branched-subunit amino acid transport system ATPase component/ABC-type branched-subunit amino acid transport system permease subunit
MTTAVQFAILGLGVGAVYALLAQGLVAIHRASGVLNFSQAALGMVASFVLLDLREEHQWGVAPALLVVIGSSAIVGVLVYQGIMRPLQNASSLQRVIATLGVLLVLQSVAVIRWGDATRFATSVIPIEPVEVAGVTIGQDRLWLVGIACALTLVLWLASRFTLLGLATTAVAENRRAAAALAWSPAWVATFNWALGFALAATAGILIAPLTGIQVGSMPLLIIPATAAALIGGFKSFPLTLAAALGIGIAQSLAGNYTDQQGLASSLPFLVLVVVLVLQGKSLPQRGHLMERMPLLGSGQVRPIWVAVCFLLAAGAMQFVFSDELLSAVTISLISATLMLSVVVLTGYAGQLSLAQAAIAGLGAMFAARLVADDTMPFALAVVVGVLGGVVVGLVFAVPALRTRGVALAAVTLGLGAAVNAMVFANPSFTGGYDGTPVGPQRLFGIDISSITHPDRYGLLALVAFVLVALMVANVRRGPIGRRLVAVRSNERAAAALGVSVIGSKLYAFALAAGIAGLAGVLMGFRANTVTFEPFSPFQSILVVAYAVIGGVGFIVGPLLGSTLTPGGVGTFITNQIFDPATATPYIALVGGIILILIQISQPDGMTSANIQFGRKVASMWSRTGRRTEPRRAEVLTPSERPPVTPATLEVSNVTVRFSGVTALSAVSVKAEPGKIVGVIGPNGAGKTTLIDVISGFLAPASGEVHLNGRSMARMSVARRARAGVGRSFQALELFEDISVRDNLKSASDSRERAALVTNLVRPGKAPLPPAAVAAIEEFGLLDDLDKLPTELPYGRRRLVAIARAVAMEPSVLLLDEPAAGLSESETAELAALVRRLADRWGMAIVLIEHDMTFVMSVCDSVTVLDFGQQIASGSVDEIRNDPQVRAAYLGGADDDVADVLDSGPLESLVSTEGGTK